MSNNKNNLISIIVPIYNVENYLKEALDSIKNQSFQEFEVILIDDGSTDRSSDIARQYSNADSRFKYFRTENFGQSHARNIGLLEAEGDFISFIDPDDSVKPYFLEKLIKRFHEDTAIVSYKFPSNEQRGKLEGEINIDSFYSGMFSGELGTVVWNKVFRRSILKNVTFPEGQIHEEIAFYHQLLSVLNGYRISVIDDNMAYNYRVIRNGNTRSTFNPKRIIGAKDAIKLITDLEKTSNFHAMRTVQLDTLVFIKNYISLVNQMENKSEAIQLFVDLYRSTKKQNIFLINPIWTLSLIKYRLGLGLNRQNE